MGAGNAKTAQKTTNAGLVMCLVVTTCLSIPMLIFRSAPKGLCGLDRLVKVNIKASYHCTCCTFCDMSLDFVFALLHVSSEQHWHSLTHCKPSPSMQERCCCPSNVGACLLPRPLCQVSANQNMSQHDASILGHLVFSLVQYGISLDVVHRAC